MARGVALREQMRHQHRAAAYVRFGHSQDVETDVSWLLIH